ncbi:hypothetical protein Nhal_4019 (plasmid) [Nitrosococcus halophilus Nc 4]|uniref:HEPN AbiU2-like domain-containing protein n=1 Tax=Nitrosococcus halophilus (strain Nc4) TaxID=472759 RepID=D5C5H3_NITHN|nr:hypothetical protein [Nitrosococcus halophilus]ADE17027.1 hypothetical protein Nhal_4019 [Nitrosococcus halophilus Nc 4]
MESSMLNFDNLTERLVEEIRSAAMHLDLYKSIRSSILRYRAGVNRSPNFWSLTLNAHLESTRASLCRVYDQTSRGNLTIKSWLEEFKAHHLKDEFFEPSEIDKFNRKPLVPNEIDQDLELVSSSDELVDTLFKRHRNNEVAHISMKLVSRGESYWKSYPLTYDDYEKLISRAENIINKYMAHHNSTSFALLSIFQKDDYQYVMESIEKNATQQKNAADAS